jgi:hypothetical protein
MSEENIDPEVKKELDEFIYFLDHVTGRRQDLRGRVELFTNPRTPLTATNLTPPLVEVIVDCIQDGDNFPELEPMKEWATEECLGMLSKEGFALQKATESFQSQNQDKGALQIIQGALGSVKDAVTGPAKE